MTHRLNATPSNDELRLVGTAAGRSPRRAAYGARVPSLALFLLHARAYNGRLLILAFRIERARLARSVALRQVVHLGLAFVCCHL